MSATAPNRPCDTCAFGKSGGARAEPKNHLKGLICAHGLIPFWCHHTKSGVEYDWKGENGKRPELTFLELPKHERKICAGWKRAVRILKRRGYFDQPDFRIIRRVVAAKTIALLDEATASGLSAEAKEREMAELHRCCRFLFAKDIGPLEIPL